MDFPFSWSPQHSSFTYYCNAENLNIPGLVQVRLNNRGCVQYDNLGGPSLIRELLWAQGWTIPLAAMVFFAAQFMIRHGPVEIVQLCVCFPIAALIGYFVWGKCRRFRRAIRQVRDGSIADANAAYYQSTPWEEVDNFTLVPVNENHHLRVQRDGGPYRKAYPGAIVIDAEIRANSEQISQLKELLNQWIARAKTAVNG
jgi:hypothetical protein